MADTIDKTPALCYTSSSSSSFAWFYRGKMYKKVLLTDNEIALLKRVIGDYLHEKIFPEARNLQHIHRRLIDIKPTEKYVQSIN